MVPVLHKRRDISFGPLWWQTARAVLRGSRGLTASLLSCEMRGNPHCSTAQKMVPQHSYLSLPRDPSTLVSRLGSGFLRLPQSCGKKANYSCWQARLLCHVSVPGQNLGIRATRLGVRYNIYILLGLGVWVTRGWGRASN